MASAAEAAQKHLDNALAHHLDAGNSAEEALSAWESLVLAESAGEGDVMIDVPAQESTTAPDRAAILARVMKQSSACPVTSDGPSCDMTYAAAAQPEKFPQGAALLGLQRQLDATLEQQQLDTSSGKAQREKLEGAWEHFVLVESGCDKGSSEAGEATDQNANREPITPTRVAACTDTRATPADAKLERPTRVAPVQLEGETCKSFASVASVASPLRSREQDFVKEKRRSAPFYASVMDQLAGELKAGERIGKPMAVSQPTSEPVLKPEVELQPLQKIEPQEERMDVLPNDCSVAVGMRRQVEVTPEKRRGNTVAEKAQTLGVDDHVFVDIPLGQEDIAIASTIDLESTPLKARPVSQNIAKGGLCGCLQGVVKVAMQWMGGSYIGCRMRTLFPGTSSSPHPAAYGVPCKNSQYVAQHDLV